jgi:superfamily II RNA helicase
MSLLNIPSTSEQAVGYPPSDPAILYNFPLDPFQQQAILAIHRNENVLVTAKTGSGKTLVGEYQIAYTLREKKRVFYTTPIKSLSNQKYHDLKVLFPHASVGIMTGDIKNNPEAEIVVMTTEILRNLLFKQTTPLQSFGTAGQLSLDMLGAVIFDEVHYINDPERGHVWEETLILMPHSVRLILLSATIDSPDEFAGWLGTMKQTPITLLKTSHRVVPLIHGVYDPEPSPLPIRPLKDGDEAPFQGEVYSKWLRDRESRIKASEDWAKRIAKAKASGDSIAGSSGKVKLQSFTHTLNECIDKLSQRSLLPALFFVFSRKECERYAEQITQTLINSADVASIKHIMQFHLHRYNETLEHLPQYHQIVRLLERGIAFHHSGVLPLLKEIIELLFSRGFIKVLFCTETFAVGLNMPARTVVFLDLKKPSDESDGFRPLRADEYIQMAGRAGRRGKDTQGVVMYMPSRQPLLSEEIRSCLTGSLVSLESRLQFHYDFILKALLVSQKPTGNASVDKKPLWETLIQSSYWETQRQKAIQTTEKEREELQLQQRGLPILPSERAEFEIRQSLVDAVKSSVNAARRKAQAALDTWKDRHMGPKWAAAEKINDQYNRIDTQILTKTKTIASLSNSVFASRIQPVLGALNEWKALACISDETTPSLTEFGILATEVNEANPLLVSQLYTSGLLAEASCEEIVCVLGSLIVDREALQKTVHPRALGNRISERVKETLMTMDTWGQRGSAIDIRHGVSSPEMFWSLTTLWVEIGYDWLNGVSAAELTKKYEMYEGNLMRGLLKLMNIVNEWYTIATYKADVRMLDTLKTAQSQILRDIAQPESLYLRMN